MDCAIILCMAGGFPPSAVCAAAHAEMIRRVTPIPVQPPFGVCSFTGAPVALGGTGGIEDLDISTPDFAWLRRTRVLWWRGRHYQPEDEFQQWDWSIRSCDPQMDDCVYLIEEHGSITPWPDTFETENGQILPTAKVGGVGQFSGRAVLVEFADFAGWLGHTRWIRY